MDPLGFDRAYSSLADRGLPGLTNVAEEGERGAFGSIGVRED